MRLYLKPKEKIMEAKYVDGFVLVIKKSKVEEYKAMALKGQDVWKKHGALDYKECIADDMNPEWVTFTFPQMAKAQPDEVVIFAFITYKSRKDRDSVNAKVMADPLMNDPEQKDKPMPFDMKRMAYGGFEVLVG
jgi:uncharacterized protein YbaA (DUF1428 family)